MLASHPLQKITPKAEPFVLFFLLVATITLTIFLSIWCEVLVHDQAPYGIVSFELVWNLEGLERVIGPWSEAVRTEAIRIILIDYAYLLLYSTTLALICLMVGRWSRAWNLNFYSRLGLIIAWLAWIAGLCDAIENAASLKLLLSEPVAPWPWVMSFFAAVKFTLLGLVALYLVATPVVSKIVRKI